MYDYLVVGSGLFGAVFARQATDAGKTVLVIDKRPNVAGNVYTEKVEGINFHKYGAHIFHTNNTEVWNYVNRFATFNRFTNSPDGIEVQLNVDYLVDRAKWDAIAEKVVYTGAIDAFFNYSLGNLEYRSVRFENEVLDIPNFQGNAAVNYTDRETPWTRIIEHKWFEFGKDENGNDLPKTIISREYSSEWKPGDEPYYPVNDEKNGALYKEYRALADQEGKVIFGGRLGEYKYYDMDAVIASALECVKRELR